MNFRHLNPPAMKPSRRRALKDPEVNSIHEDVIVSEEFSNLSGDELDLLLFHVKESVKDMAFTENCEKFDIRDADQGR
jgi:hypothetical protein